MRGFNRCIGFLIMRFNIVLVVLFLMGNIIYITIRVKDIASLIERSALLYIINLMPLALEEHINPIASIFKVQLSASANIYK